MGDVDELSSLKQRLREAEATLEAIRDGRVDAVVVEGSSGHHVYSLESADLPYRQFLEQMGEGAVSLDAQGTVLFSNRFFADLLGLPREQVLGRSFEPLVTADTLGVFRAGLHADQPSRVAVSLELPDGRKVPVQIAVTPVGEESERRFTLVITDLTERDRATALALGREAAEAASLAKDQFLAAVCHELRSPLNAMLGWTHMLRESREPHGPQTLRALDVIERNARLQAKLIEDLLDVSRVVSGKLSIDRALTDLAEVARSTVSSLLPQAAAKGLSLELHVEGSCGVEGDAARLQQVLSNLIGNALKFTPSGGHIVCRVERSDGRVRITVKDDGQGIAPSMLPQVFQLFRQGTEGQSRRGGLGLGLSITKHLVERHDGTIHAESEGLGRGATFTIELPARGELGAESQVHEPPTSLRGLRTLLVDDEEDTREVTARVLRKAGAEVVTVADAQAALARLDGDSFDLIVSDLMMPGTSGWELARIVRTRYGTRVPLLAVSSLHGGEQEERARAAGFNAFVTKPLEESTLTRVRRTLFSPRANLQG